MRCFRPLPQPRVAGIGAVILSALMIAGCGPEGPQGGPRVETYPITGTVHIDGKPEQAILVTCHPVGESAVHTTISGFTDEQGRFSIGTYESGDGAPEGEYKLTVKWGQWGLNGRYGGPDKLKDRYSDPDSSEYSVVVSPGNEADVGILELSTE